MNAALTNLFLTLCGATAVFAFSFPPGSRGAETGIVLFFLSFAGAVTSFIGGAFADWRRPRQPPSPMA